MHMQQNGIPRYATEDELKELRQCELEYTADMGAVFDELNEGEWEATSKPILSLVFDDPDVCSAITGKAYQKLMFSLWSSTSHMLYGWKDGRLEALPPDEEFLEQYRL